MDNIYRFLFSSYIRCPKWQKLLDYLLPFLLHNPYFSRFYSSEQSEELRAAWAWQGELNLPLPNLDTSFYRANGESAPNSKNIAECGELDFENLTLGARSLAVTAPAVGRGHWAKNLHLSIYLYAGVAEHLHSLGLDQTCVMAPLLYFLLREGVASPLDLYEYFGEVAAKIVLGLARIDNLKLRRGLNDLKQREKLYKLIIALALDARVIMIKIAFIIEKLNLLLIKRDVGLADSDMAKKEQLLFEALHIYAPLAERVGMQHFKNKLQDLAFNLENPHLYRAISQKMYYFRHLSFDVLLNLRESILELLNEAGLKVVVIAREKQIYAIWQKMYKKKQFFSNLFDILALRIITTNKEQCYQVRSELMRHFHVISEGNKDYIAQPKTNNYQALHMVLICPKSGKMVEIQIRSASMHRMAELGLAAHWAYKQGIVPKHIEIEQLQFLRNLLQYQVNNNLGESLWLNAQLLPNNSAGSASECAASSLELLYPHVFCFTPQGEIINLTRGATVLDFAFAIHQELGYFCRGGRINGKIAPLNALLSNGDTVEIIRGAAVPKQKNMRGAYLLKAVATRKARRCLRKLGSERAETC